MGIIRLSSTARETSAFRESGFRGLPDAYPVGHVAIHRQAGFAHAHHHHAVSVGPEQLDRGAGHKSHFSQPPALPIKAGHRRHAPYAAASGRGKRQRFRRVPRNRSRHHNHMPPTISGRLLSVKGGVSRLSAFPLTRAGVSAYNGRTGWFFIADAVLRRAPFSAHPPDALPMAEDSCHSDPLLGTRLGGFGLVERLGRGGMGWVYRAHDAGLDRWVAVKVLPPEFARDSGTVARFLREARTLARLRHPNLAAIHAVGEDGGWRYFVMELVDGASLARRLGARGPLPWLESLDIAGQMLAALAAAHAVGIVHRDVKPANVMIEPAGRVALVDFGLARSERHDNLTEHGVWVGTPDYMAPEQADGGATPAGDLYALGAVWFEMLAGVPPFRRDTWMKTLRDKVETPCPEWPAARSGCPPAFADLGRRLLSPRPEDRPADACALARELSVFADTPALQSILAAERQVADARLAPTVAGTVPAVDCGESGGGMRDSPSPQGFGGAEEPPESSMRFPATEPSGPSRQAIVDAMPPSPPLPSPRPAEGAKAGTPATTASAPTLARRLRRRRLWAGWITAVALGLAVGLIGGQWMAAMRGAERPRNGGPPGEGSQGRQGGRSGPGTGSRRERTFEDMSRRWGGGQRPGAVVAGRLPPLAAQMPSYEALQRDDGYHDYMRRRPPADGDGEPDAEADRRFFVDTLEAAGALAAKWREQGVLEDRLRAVRPREARSSAPSASLLLSAEDYLPTLLAQEAWLAYMALPPPEASGSGSTSRERERGERERAFWPDYWDRYAKLAAQTQWPGDERARIDERIEHLRRRLAAAKAVAAEN